MSDDSPECQALVCFEIKIMIGKSRFLLVRHSALRMKTYAYKTF